MKYVSTLLALLITGTCGATHFLGGEIRYTHLDGLIHSIEARMYTCSDSPADRPEITIDFGDGSSAVVPRDEIIDGPGQGCCPIRLSIYRTTHQYNGTGAYDIRYDDIGRTSGIVNMTNPTSQGVCVKARLYIHPIVGVNNSVQFTSPQGETTQNWNTVVHDPQAIDPDGDSLSFELVVPLGENCQPIASYQTPWAQNLFWLDPTTGVLLWDHPLLIGLWSIAIRCTEWRNGYIVGQTTRDMVICVSSIFVGMNEVPVQAPFEFRTEVDAIQIVNTTTAPADLVVIGIKGDVVLQRTLAPGSHRIVLSTWGTGTYVAIITGPRAGSSTLHFAKH